MPRLLGVMAMFVVAIFPTQAPAMAGSLGSGPLVRLDGGRIGSYRWEVMLQRGRGPHGGRQPCIGVSSPDVPRRLSGSTLTVCGYLEALPILLAKSSGSGRAERTVLAIAYKPEVTSVRLWLKGRRSRLVRLRLLDRARARRAGVERFRYASLGIAQRFCLKRFVSYDGEGKVVDPGQRMPCGR